jgi:hypothetical protein
MAWIILLEWILLRMRKSWGQRSEAGVRRQEFLYADASVEVSADPICDSGDDLAAIAARVHVGAERAVAGGHADDPHDLVRDVLDVCVWGFKRGQAGRELLAQRGVLHVVRPFDLVAVGSSWCRKWFVPDVKAPGTTIVVSIPKRMSSAA